MTRKERIQAVVFDVDGVLVDSLPAHLAICQQKAREYDLDLTVPGPAQFRELIMSGTAVSPMPKFFEAVGFPTHLAEKADADYRRDFSRDYSPMPFEGVELMLSRMQSAGIGLGIVTSNTRANVRRVLGNLMTYFGTLVVAHDDPQGRTKPAALRQVLKELQLPADLVAYVGDQPSDAAAANSVGMRFLGVAYGWGLTKDDRHVPIVDSPGRVADHFLATDDGSERGQPNSFRHAS